MQELYIVLFAAHLLGDFVCQPASLVKAKQTWWGLLVHAVIVTITTAILVATKQWWIYPAVFIGHFCIDATKKIVGKDGVYAFLIDQAAHLSLLAGIVYLFPDAIEKSLWKPCMPSYINGLVLLSGLILSVPVGSVLISKATASLVNELNAKVSEGLTNGGKWIGQLERALSFILICFSQAGAIGFLFAAKSILRFGEINNPNHRKEAEYIIIGTFMSFGWAILIANLTIRVLTLLQT